MIKELKEGWAILSEVELGWTKVDDDDLFDERYVKFTLDGVPYVAIEDQSDGYRSWLNLCRADSIDSVLEKTSSTKLPDVEVNVKHSDDEDNDIWYLYDAKTNKIVLKVGTFDFADYYPCRVLSWDPENLYINSNVEV